ncbi:MAG: hypothetical protein M1333_00640 [Patescibacteria group bacterium]|nr:hypothetical protein [Patescibacteria group bacterium]
MVQDDINSLTGLSADLKAQGQKLLDQAAVVDKSIQTLKEGYQSDQDAIDAAVKAKLDAAKTALEA